MELVAAQSAREKMKDCEHDHEVILCFEKPVKQGRVVVVVEEAHRHPLSFILPTDIASYSPTSGSFM